jgi:hypothetical protein
MPDDINDDQNAPRIVSEPNEVVDGLTIRQWAEHYLTAAFAAPGGPSNPLHDPTGAAAVSFNSAGGPMYFITEAHAGLTRTFNVAHGTDVLLPIAFAEDTEGSGISPSIPNFNGTAAAEVLRVMATSHFANVTLSLDGKPVSDLEETKSGIFSAGAIQAGSVAQGFFGAAPGTSLATTGLEGYFVVLKDLAPGTHTIVSTSSFNSQFIGNGPLGTHTDIIKVT